MGWVCSCYRFLHIKKKKKSCASRNDKGCFPTPAPESPWVQLTALAPKGSAHLFNHLGQRLPPHHGLAKGLPALRKGNLMSAPTQRCGSSFQRKRQKGLHPRKKKRHFVVSKSPHFNQREYKFLCAQTSTIVFKKENKKERGEKSPRHIPRQPFVGLSWLLGHGSGQRLFKEFLSLGKTSPGWNPFTRDLEKQVSRWPQLWDQEQRSIRPGFPVEIGTYQLPSHCGCIPRGKGK